MELKTQSNFTMVISVQKCASPWQRRSRTAVSSDLAKLFVGTLGVELAIWQCGDRAVSDGFTVMVQLHMGPTQTGKEWIIASGRGQVNVGQTKLVARLHGTNLSPQAAATICAPKQMPNTGMAAASSVRTNALMASIQGSSEVAGPLPSHDHQCIDVAAVGWDRISLVGTDEDQSVAKVLQHHGKTFGGSG